MSLIFQTSGTTGKPKQVLVDDMAVEARLALYKKHLPIKSGEKVLRVIPGDGSNNFSRIASVIHPERSGAKVRQYEGGPLGKADVIFAFWHIFAPALARIDKPVRKGGPRLIVFGGFPFYEQQRLMVKEKFPKATVLSNYGSSEVGVMALTEDRPLLTGEVGKPFVDFKITGGSILFRGDYLAASYKDGPAIRGDWFEQGDVAYMKGESLHVTGRRTL